VGLTVGKVRSGFHLYLISNLQKNNTDHFCLKSFLENIDIDNFLSETDVGQKVPEKVEKDRTSTEYQ